MRKKNVSHITAAILAAFVITTAALFFGSCSSSPYVYVVDSNIPPEECAVLQMVTGYDEFRNTILYIRITAIDGVDVSPGSKNGLSRDDTIILPAGEHYFLVSVSNGHLEDSLNDIDREISYYFDAGINYQIAPNKDSYFYGDFFVGGISITEVWPD